MTRCLPTVRDMDGTWSLYVRDAVGSDAGVIGGGWRLDLDVGTPLCCASNQPPLLAAIGNRTVIESNSLNIIVSAVDPFDGDAITLSASNLPPGAVFAPITQDAAVTQTFSWAQATPPGVYTTLLATNGNYFAADKAYVTYASDALDLSPSPGQSVFIEVLRTSGERMLIDDFAISTLPDGGSPRTPPILMPIGSKSVLAGNALAFAILATPTDGDDVTLSADNLPAGASFTAEGSLGYFTWPHAMPVGAYAVTFHADDVDGRASETVSIAVQEVGAEATETFSNLNAPAGAYGGGAYAGDGGIDDQYELDLFGSLTNINATSDWDGDGFIDGHEYRAGTSPTNALSLLKFMSAEPIAGDQVVIRWQSASNRIYGLWRSLDPALGFAPLATGLPATPPENTYTDAVPPGVQGAYRIDLEFP